MRGAARAVAARTSRAVADLYTVMQELYVSAAAFHGASKITCLTKL